METEKSTRLLYLYQDLTKGVGIQKKAAADRFGVKLVGLLCWPIKQAKQQNLPGRSLVCKKTAQVLNVPLKTALIDAKAVSGSLLLYSNTLNEVLIQV